LSSRSVFLAPTLTLALSFLFREAINPVYGWYQSRWHASAGQIYDLAGVEGFSKLWNAFMYQKSVLNDHDLVIFLSTVHQSLADVLLKWDN